METAKFAKIIIPLIYMKTSTELYGGFEVFTAVDMKSIIF
jgi:hypothetical protein